MRIIEHPKYMRRFWKKMQPAKAVPGLRSHFKLKRPQEINAYKGEWHSIHYASTCLLRQPVEPFILETRLMLPAYIGM